MLRSTNYDLLAYLEPCIAIVCLCKIPKILLCTNGNALRVASSHFNFGIGAYLIRSIEDAQFPWEFTIVLSIENVMKTTA